MIIKQAFGVMDSCKMAVFFALGVGFFSLSAQAADLLDIYRLAQRNDPTFEVARYTLKAAQQKYPLALAGLLPTVNVSGANNRTHAQTQFSNAQGINRYVQAWNWSLQLTQPLIRLQNVYAYDEANQAVEQAQAQYNLAEQDIILRVTQAYFGVLASGESIRVAEAELAATAEQLALAKYGFDKGISALTDVLEGQSKFDLARSHLVSTQNELDAKSAELAKIVDVVPSPLAILDSSADLPPLNRVIRSFGLTKRATTIPPSVPPNLVCCLPRRLLVKLAQNMLPP